MPGRGHFELWDWKAKKALHPLDTGTANRIENPAFRADGKQVAVRIDRQILLFDTATGKRAATIEPVNWCAAVAPDGRTVAVAGDSLVDDHTARNHSRVGFWDAKTGRIGFPVRSHAAFMREWCYGLSYLPNGRHLVLVGSAGLLIWDVTAEVLVETGKEAAVPLGRGTVVSFTPTTDGVYVAAITKTGVIHVWKVTPPPAKKPLSPHSERRDHFHEPVQQGGHLYATGPFSFSPGPVRAVDFADVNVRGVKPTEFEVVVRVTHQDWSHARHPTGSKGNGALTPSRLVNPSPDAG